jgi:isoleucyl-tRNA synthetase
MSEYKNTLNLPNTAFAMKANLAQREPAILAKWQSMGLYEQLRERGKTLPKYVLHAGPPYANGHIHLGTATTTILKDMVVKSKTMSGFDAPFVPGWDCHGLPIELNVEKKVGKPGHKISVPAFRQACRDYANVQVNTQRGEFKRLGIQADWENPYITMDFQYEADELRCLAKIIAKGYLQKGYKPVHWCLDCSSALAEAEVEHMDKTSLAVDVSFTVVDKKLFLERFVTPVLLAENLQQDPSYKITIPIWTTTPWSLPANQAVALHPAVNYVLVNCNDQQGLLVAEPLLAIIMQRYGISDFHIVGEIAGAQLENILVQHPFYVWQVPVISGEHVTVDAGTGAVHIAPAHGQDDYELGKKYHLPMENPVGNDGCYIENTPLLAGVHVAKANDAIIDLLKQNDNLLHLAKINHSYPHCWRHKSPLIMRATPQWFIRMAPLQPMAITAIDNVQWIPEWGQNRISLMVGNRPDWCISRQRTWGVPIALFLHKETSEPHPDSVELLEKIAQRVELHGVDAWFNLEPTELLGADAAMYRKCNDILDVWFDSGVSHDCVLRKNPSLQFPADLYLEGSDQHRGWFQSSLLTSLAINECAPYKTVLTHGYVIDVQGQKMSKSLGNVVAPEEVIQTLGADVLRLWVASVDYRAEINVSKEILTRASETYRRLRNTARFLLANLDGFDPAIHLIKPEAMLSLDRWVIDRTRLLQAEIIKAYESCQFHLIYQKIHYFCAIELGGFYLDVIKDRQYTTRVDSIARRSAQTAIYHIIEAFVRWVAPILSFTAEEIWEFIPGAREASVFFSTWYTQLAALPESQIMNAAYWEKIRLVRDAVNKEIEAQRNAGKIGSALEADVNLYCDEVLQQQLLALEGELHFVLITSAAHIYPAADQRVDVVATEVPGLWLNIMPVSSAKCERCWHRQADVGSNALHPTLCERCVDNIEGSGEVRRYA